MIRWWKEYRVLLITVGVLALLFWISLPRQLFSDPLSTVVYDRNGDLLGARIAHDGQWRFPGVDTVPEKYAAALIRFEDRYFYYHPGVNPASLGRALIQNIQAGAVKSGGSTITMQVMRMSRKNRPRNLLQKLIETYLSLRYELSSSKTDILTDYANNAPFGGNVVGIEAASWRYFGTAPENLTWSESALLAVLPNAPALIHPGRNRDLLKMKRDNLLQLLKDKGIIDEITLRLATGEPLPGNPLPLPDIAPHLTDRVMMDKRTDRYYSTIDRAIQERVNERTAIRQEILEGNQVNNMACLVLEIESGEVLAYVGNSGSTSDLHHGKSVDVIRAPRSSGSILKPFLFAGMLDNGDLIQTTLVPDVPIRYNGYAPKNYDREYEGAVPAYEALKRSLNIPSVIMLKNYGVDPFLGLLRNLGFTTFKKSHEHYGLTLILGGAETTLWELAGTYASMARSLNHYTRSDGNYIHADYHMPVLEKNKKDSHEGLQEEGVLSASSIYLTFKSLLEVNRPEELSLWYLMSSTRNIAWKTGTSYGFRDAWAVGVTPEYLVAVWAGNADGEGRPGLSGITAAAPLMFDVFSGLPETSWFEPPLDDLAEAVVCSQSGYIAGPGCVDTDTIMIVPKGRITRACPFHHTIHLDETGNFRVNSNCYPVRKMQSRPWFILPPLMEWYYKQSDPRYQSMPPIMEGCHDESVQELEIVYPEWNSHLVIPRELDGSKGKVVMEVAHRQSAAMVYWHIDDAYVGSTNRVHQLALDITPGRHTMTVVDEKGNSASVNFEVLR
ncbi:MAG: penicillin-binding protein 1C [Bacteroidales bacterium]